MRLKAFRTLRLFFLTTLFLLLCSGIAHCSLAPGFTLTDIDGRTFSLSDFRGKVVILNFFSSRCGPCNTEMSHLKAVQNEFGVRLVIISLSVRLSYDTDEILRQFRDDHGITWIVARDTANVHEKYDVPTIPTLYIIDQKGDIRYHHFGLTEASVIIEEINELLIAETPITVSLTVTTSPSLQDVHFRVDGDDYYTSTGSFSVELEVGQHQIELMDTVVRESEDTEYRFSCWSGISSGSSNPKQIEIAASSSLEAVFETCYKTVFTQSGSEGAPHVTVDGKSYTLPQTFWFDGGSSHSFSYETPVSGGTGIRYVLTSTSHTSPITVTSSTTVTGHYKTQYFITVISPHDSPTPSQWVDEGGSPTASVTSPADDDGAGTRYRCTGYRIDDGSLQSDTSYTFTSIQAPHKIDFQWIPQHRLVASSTHGSPNPSGVNWYDSGMPVSATVTSPADDDDAGTRQKCTGWTGTGSVPSAGTSASVTFPLDSPSSITWNWIPQYQMTFTESGLDAGRSITIIVNGIPHLGTSPFSYSEWYDRDFSVTLSISDQVDSEDSGKRYVLINWKNSVGAIITSPHTICDPETLTAYYQTQYYLIVNTEPVGLNPQPSVSPSSSWYDVGTLVTRVAQVVDGYNFDHWILDGAPREEGNMELTITMDMTHNATAHYALTTDLNSDGRIDDADISLIASAFHSEIEDKDYDPRMDLDNNGAIDIIDVATIAKDFGKTT